MYFGSLKKENQENLGEPGEPYIYIPYIDFLEKGEPLAYVTIYIFYKKENHF